MASWFGAQTPSAIPEHIKIMNSHYITHTEPLLKHLRFLKVEDMFSLKILFFLHKLLHYDLPPSFQ